MTVCTYRGVRYVPHRPLSADMVLRYERRIHLERQLEAAHHLERMYRGSVTEVCLFLMASCSVPDAHVSIGSAYQSELT